jgi:predicted phage terminase large subunit-like protein
VLKVVEDKANGPAVISALGRIVPGIVPEEPQGGKEARAAAVSPLQEAGNVWLPSPELAPWVGGLIDEAAGFPTAAHDDQVDAMSQGLNRIVLQPLMAGLIVTAEDLDEELADHGSYVPG